MGFSMPAEWAPHAGTWTAWPHDDEQWLGYLEPVRKEFAVFLNTLARFEPVNLLLADQESLSDAKSRLSGTLTFHLVPHNDLWLRDSGPIFVTRKFPVPLEGREESTAAEAALVNWEFNGWGKKYPAELDNQIPTHLARILGTGTFGAGVVMEGGSLEVNGRGVALTTKQCLLSPMRNPELKPGEIELYLREYLRIEKLLWLGEGLEGDHTDGHIDTITRFVDEKTVVTSVCQDPADANYAPLRENLEALRGFTDLDDRPFKIATLPLPKNRLYLDGVRLAPTYANFYIANGVVIVPIYGDPNDQPALDTLKPLFPGRKVIGLMARNLITGGGAFHCVTQQQPAGRIWRAANV